jgi:tRNA threonylcarbamoyladenosine biosynthesis protein TsaB
VRTTDEPLILSLETTTRAGSIALTHSGRVLSARQGEAQASHSTDLLKNIRAVLLEAGCSLNDISLFAVASGPGSFTGLRIGVATVKSFSATLERPSIGVPTLHAVAIAAGPSRRTLAMIPAGRGEVFAQLLAVEPGGVPNPLAAPMHQPPRELLVSLKGIGGLKLAGEAVELYLDEISSCARQNGIAIEREGEEDGSTVELIDVPDEVSTWSLHSPIKNLAVHVAAEAGRLFRSGLEGRPEDLHAIYVRPSDAELNEKCLEQNKPAG